MEKQALVGEIVGKLNILENGVDWSDPLRLDY